MESILFVIYLLLFSWMVSRLKFFTNSGLTKRHLVILFLLKVVAGIAYAWLALYNQTSGYISDTWNFHLLGLEESKLFFTDPQKYFTNIFIDPYGNNYSGFFASKQSYWNNLKGNAFIKLLSIFNFFSLGNYYINLIFYSFITFFGVVGIYKVMKDHYPKYNNLLIIGCFLVPSFLYWSSGLHKEGLTFLGISLIIYHINFGLLKKNITAIAYLGIFCGFLILFVLRPYLLLPLLPALLIWILATANPKYLWQIFAAVYLFFVISFFGLKYIHPQLNLPAAVTNKQYAFKELNVGRTSTPVKEIEPSFIGFIKGIPQALSLTVVRPNLNDIDKLIILPAFIEHKILWVLYILFFRFRRKDVKPYGFNVAIFCFCIATVVFVIGLSVNNLGAMVRYRSIIYPLLIPLILTGIDWARLKQIINRN